MSSNSSELSSQGPRFWTYVTPTNAHFSIVTARVEGTPIIKTKSGEGWTQLRHFTEICSFKS